MTHAAVAATAFFLIAMFAPTHHGIGSHTTHHLVNEAYEAFHGHTPRRHRH